MIAELREDEAAAAIALWQAAGLTHLWNGPAEDIAAALAHPTATIFAAHDEAGTLVGTVMAGYDGHRGWLYLLAVAESERGRGTGAALVQAAEAWLKGLGAPGVRLLVYEGNAAARAFYEAIGYERADLVAYGRKF